MYVAGYQCIFRASSKLYAERVGDMLPEKLQFILSRAYTIAGSSKVVQLLVAPTSSVADDAQGLSEELAQLTADQLADPTLPQSRKRVPVGGQGPVLRKDTYERPINALAKMNHISVRCPDTHPTIGLVDVLNEVNRYSQTCEFFGADLPQPNLQLFLEQITLSPTRS